MPNPEVIGGFEFTTERPVNCTFDRPRSVHGRLIRKTSKASRDNSIPPICYTNVNQVPAGYDRGHLIGLSLGGPDTPKNLVPMLSFFNRVEYKQLEALLKLELATNPTVYIGILVDYFAAAPWCPEKFTIHRHFGDPTRSAEPTVIYHRALSRQPFTIPDEIWNHIVSNAAAFCKQFQVPDDQPLPYSFFELTEYRPAVRPISDFSAGKFSKIQRQCVWSLNCYNNNGKAKHGWLVSDAPGDFYRDLNPKGCLDFPEVDHITPYSASGTNSFFNAQLTSAHFNRSKSAALSQIGDQAPLRTSGRNRQEPDRYNPTRK